MNEKKVASLETWKALGDDGQAEIALKAAKRATYIARCYGVELTADELWGKTREDIVERLDAAYLDRHNQRLALDADGLDNLLPQLSPRLCSASLAAHRTQPDSITT